MLAQRRPCERRRGERGHGSERGGSSVSRRKKTVMSAPALRAQQAHRSGAHTVVRDMLTPGQCSETTGKLCVTWQVTWQLASQAFFTVAFQQRVLHSHSHGERPVGVILSIGLQICDDVVQQVRPLRVAAVAHANVKGREMNV